MDGVVQRECIPRLYVEQKVGEALGGPVDQTHGHIIPRPVGKTIVMGLPLLDELFNSDPLLDIYALLRIKHLAVQLFVGILIGGRSSTTRCCGAFLGGGTSEHARGQDTPRRTPIWRDCDEMAARGSRHSEAHSSGRTPLLMTAGHRWGPLRLSRGLEGCL